MEERIAILADSGCDLPAEFMQQENVFVLPLKLNYDGGEIYSDEEFDPLEVYRRFPQRIPKTSTPNLFEAGEMLKKIKENGYNKVIAICISSGLSGTFNTIKTALEKAEIEGFAFDTKNISIGSGFYALWVDKMQKAGMGFQEIANMLPKKLQDSDVYFYMDTLDYLKAGGRIGKVTATMGSVLNIKPIITCNTEGIYHVISMIRGKKQSLNKMFQTVKDRVNEGEAWFGIMNGDAEADAAHVKELLLNEITTAKVVTEKQIVASMAIHTGPGLVGVGVFNPRLV